MCLFKILNSSFSKINIYIYTVINTKINVNMEIKIQENIVGQ